MKYVILSALIFVSSVLPMDSDYSDDVLRLNLLRESVHRFEQAIEVIKKRRFVAATVWWVGMASGLFAHWKIKKHEKQKTQEWIWNNESKPEAEVGSQEEITPEIPPLSKAWSWIRGISLSAAAFSTGYRLLTFVRLKGLERRLNAVRLDIRRQEQMHRARPAPHASAGASANTTREQRRQEEQRQHQRAFERALYELRMSPEEREENAIYSVVNPMPDYYGDLGVTHNADRAAIRRAYVRLARANHPDHENNPHRAQASNAEAQIRAVTVAWGVLGDAGQRAIYDRALNRRGGPGQLGPEILR